MTKILLPATVLLSVFVAGCASTSKPNALHPGCVYPNAPTVAAPGWICDEPVNEVYLQAIGYAKPMASGVSVMRSVAEAEARAAMGRLFYNEVSSLLKRQINELTTTSGVQLDEQLTSALQSLSAMEISNSRILRTQTAPDGGIFLLLGLTQEQYQQNLQRLAQSMPSDAEIYRQFLLQEAKASLKP